MILRRRTYEKAAPSRDAQKIYIICEGKEREKDYFEFFKEISSNLCYRHRHMDGRRKNLDT